MPAAVPPLPTTQASGEPTLPPLVRPGNQVPDWARALATVSVEGVSLGETLSDLSRLLSRPATERGDASLEALRRVLGSFGEAEELDGPELLERLRRVGQFFEARVAAAVELESGTRRPTLDTAELLGLKAELLRARTSQPTGEVRKAIERVLATLDGEQLHNLARADHGESPVLQLPIPDGEGWATAWFQRDPSTGGGEEGGEEHDASGSSTLTMGLTLSALGPVRVELALDPKLLRVRLAVARPDVRAALERDLPSILADLERIGRPVAIGVELESEQRLGPPIPVVDGQVDVAG